MGRRIGTLEQEIQLIKSTGFNDSGSLRTGGNQASEMPITP